MTNFRRLDVNVEAETHEKFRYIMFIQKKSISKFLREAERLAVQQYEREHGPVRV
jgi:hypothetical protein